MTEYTSRIHATTVIDFRRIKTQKEIGVIYTKKMERSSLEITPFRRIEQKPPSF